MLSPDKRIKIQIRVDEGKITPETGVKLLSTIGDGQRAGVAVGSSRGIGARRSLRILVTDILTGRTMASVQIPIGLIDAGVKIGAHFTPEVEGVDISIVMDALKAGITGRIIDVVDDEAGEHVEVFVD